MTVPQPFPHSHICTSEALSDAVLYQLGLIVPQRSSAKAGCWMDLAGSNKVSNIAISHSSPKDCYKPIWKIAVIYLQETVSSSRWQCRVWEGRIMPLSFTGVYRSTSIPHRPPNFTECLTAKLLPQGGRWRQEDGPHPLPCALSPRLESYMFTKTHSSLHNATYSTDTPWRIRTHAHAYVDTNCTIDTDAEDVCLNYLKNASLHQTHCSHTQTHTQTHTRCSHTHTHNTHAHMHNILETQKGQTLLKAQRSRMVVFKATDPWFTVPCSSVPHLWSKSARSTQ